MRELPVVSIGTVNIGGGEFRAYIASDAELVLGDVEFISVVSRELAKLMRTYSPRAIVVPEAKAIALAYGISRELGLSRFIVARKGIKAYMGNYISTKVNSITTRG